MTRLFHVMKAPFFCATAVSMFWLAQPAVAVPPTACNLLGQTLNMEQMDELLKQRPPEFEIQLQYSAMAPELLPKMKRNETGVNFYVTPDGTVFKPKDVVLFDKDNRLIANIELLNEDSIVTDNKGQKRPLRELPFMSAYHSMKQTSEGIKPKLVTKQLRGRGVVNLAQANVVNGKLLLRSIDDMTLGANEFHRSKNLDLLADAYEGQNLPAAAYRDLRLQEYGLANTRTFEVMVTFQNKLAGYTRFYDGTRGVEMEMERFGSNNPHTEVISEGVSLGKVPTWKLPIERIFGPDAKQENPIEKMRNDPKYAGHRFIEVGRTFVNNKDFTTEQVAQVKKMMFTASKQLLESLVSEESNMGMSNIILFASSSPVGKRHYEHEYGFSEISSGPLDHEDAQSVYQKRFVLADNVEFRLDFADREGTATDSDKKPRGIHILSANASEWFQKLGDQGLLLEVDNRSRWNQAYIDPQLIPVEYHATP